MNPASPERFDYDVVITGGSLAGAATAMLLLREQPQLRVLIIERSTTFSRRVGEATVEISAYFLCRVLGMTQYLNEAHLVKQGMRFWFTNSHVQTLEDCSEIGGKYLARVAAFQVDRSVLDEEVLKRAKGLGAEVWRPAGVGKIQLNPGGKQMVEVKISGGSAENPTTETRTVSARWVVDASGFAALLARQEGWLRPNTEHPTTAVWARWTGVKDWDGMELSKKYPEWSNLCYGMRATATNHLVGPGWWAWVIPLKGGDTSVGVVFDQRYVTWAEGGSLGQRLKDFLMQHPAAREILADAQWHEGDVHWRKNLPYYCTTLAGDGFALVGDAAGFIDPFYSPGMDWLAFTSWSSAQIILAQIKGEDIKSMLEQHNRDFTRSYVRWFEAIYKDKYAYMADYELFRIAFQMDLGMYYLGVASQPFKFGIKALAQPVYSTRASVPFFYFMRFYNRRMAQMARVRRRRGTLGKDNNRHRYLVPGFTFSPKSSMPIVQALSRWAVLEICEGWRSWFEPSSKSEQPMQPVAAAADAAR